MAIPTYDLAGAGPVGPQRDGDYYGITVRNTDANVPATVIVRSTAGNLIKSDISLAGGESRDDFFADGLKCVGGMTVAITGNVEGSVRFE